MPRGKYERKREVPLVNRPDPFIFGLTARDILAVKVIRYWTDLLESYRGQNHPKVVNARRLADELEHQQRDGFVKVPD